ncbi:MAG: phosphoribosylanthranilate isomerase [bacterium]|nr:phosphoribosylanthranilate isomerase [bacterium]
MTAAGASGRVRVKVCGVTRASDAVMVEAAGADAIGVIFAAGSRRRVDLAQAADVLAPLGPFIARVGVFVDPTPSEVDAAISQLRLQVVQVHGAVAADVRDAVRGRAALVRAVSWGQAFDADEVAAWPVDAVLVDGPRAGSGERFDWTEAAVLARLPRWVLAGGLDPLNVADAIARLRPYAVDVASGVEASPGIKDATKVAAFMAAVRAAG